ncbi:MAG: hypothetical protein DHS20C01_26070 [marine bacterium B5-7]|nr:MAG: hypothetical protein DHS20C01_26070 [marine bacterium B5-7]
MVKWNRWAVGRFLLDTEDVEAIFTRVTDMVRTSWHAMLRQASISDQDYEAVHGAISTMA